MCRNIPARSWRVSWPMPPAYALLGHTLAELEAQLPPGLECVVRQPADPPEVVEAWFPA
jgi:hypothetical protein